jgi:hypothetical protein
MNQNFERLFYTTEYADDIADLGNYEKAGITLADRIKNHEWVLDIGCANFNFKSRIKNIIGIDTYNDRADFKCSFDEYVPDRMFDAIFCLGVFHFCDDEFLERQLNKMISCLNPRGRIYWRCQPVNTGDPEIDNPTRKEIEEHREQYYQWLSNCNLSPNDPGNAFDLYPWNFQRHYEVSKKFGFEVTEISYDCLNGKQYKIFAEWTKL